MCFGGGGQNTVDTGAADAAKSQAAMAEANAKRDEARWQQEQALAKQEKEELAAKEAKSEADRSKMLADANAAERAQMAAQGATGTGADMSNIQSKQRDALAGYDTAFKDLQNKVKSQQQASAGGTDYLGQSNTLVNQSGFNTKQTGGKRFYA